MVLDGPLLHRRPSGMSFHRGKDGAQMLHLGLEHGRVAAQRLVETQTALEDDGAVSNLEELVVVGDDLDQLTNRARSNTGKRLHLGHRSPDELPRVVKAGIRERADHSRRQVALRVVDLHHALSLRRKSTRDQLLGQRRDELMNRRVAVAEIVREARQILGTTEAAASELAPQLERQI